MATPLVRKAYGNALAVGGATRRPCPGLRCEPYTPRHDHPYSSASAAHAALRRPAPRRPRTGIRSRAPAQRPVLLCRTNSGSLPRALVLNEALGTELGLSPEALRSPTLLACLAGNASWPGATPYAMTYGGHQSGTWAGQLGDGRAINLGDLIDQAERRQCLQLKGAGPTPYPAARTAAPCCGHPFENTFAARPWQPLASPPPGPLPLLTGDGVLRDRSRDGQVEAEPGAIVCRVAESFLRFGHFELLAARQSRKRPDASRLPENAPFPRNSGADKARYLALYEAICQRTAALVAKWTGLGFVHHVLNTDNPSVLGLTIDHGPYGWLDRYTPGWTSTPATTEAAIALSSRSLSPSGIWLS